MLSRMLDVKIACMCFWFTFTVNRTGMVMSGRSVNLITVVLSRLGSCMWLASTKYPYFHQ